MEMTTLDNVAIGMMLVLAFIGLIIVVWNCAKLEKRIIRLEENYITLQDEVSRVTISSSSPLSKSNFPSPIEMTESLIFDDK